MTNKQYQKRFKIPREVLEQLEGRIGVLPLLVVTFCYNTSILVIYSGLYVECIFDGCLIALKLY